MQFHRQDIVKDIRNINTKTAAPPRLCMIDSTTQSKHLPIPKFINSPTTSMGLSSMLKLKRCLSHSRKQLAKRILVEPGSPSDLK